MTRPDPPDSSASNASAASRFRKRPVVVEAVQWTGANYEALRAFVGGSLPYWSSSDRSLSITLATSDRDGWKSASSQRAFIGDWIARAADDQLSVHTAKDFAATYEPADAASALRAQPEESDSVAALTQRDES